jgi:short-subunit dehydrogenase
MSYALITGASRGIGKGIALELAARKVNLLLVARDATVLEGLARDIASEFGVDVRYLAIDLSRDEAPEAVFNWTRQHGFNIEYLINNAGYGLSGKFETYPLVDHVRNMRVNMDAVVKLCYYYLPVLKAQKQSYILNIASSAAYQAVPYMGVYAASKSFVLQFSRALRYELKGTSVSLTTVSPGSTDTNFNVRANIGPKGLKMAQKVQMTPEAVAKVAVDTMLHRKAETVVGLLNKVSTFFVWLLPKAIVEKTAAGIYE